MKDVMRQLAQAKRHYSKLPLFEFLRTESIPPRDRLAFYPCMAPFIMSFGDLNRFVGETGGRMCTEVLDQSGVGRHRHRSGGVHAVSSGQCVEGVGHGAALVA